MNVSDFLCQCMLCLTYIELIFPWFVRVELFKQQSTNTSHIHEHFIYDHPCLFIIYWSFQVGENSLWIWYQIEMPFYTCLCILHPCGIHFCCFHIHPLEYLNMKITIDAHARMIFEAYKGVSKAFIIIFLFNSMMKFLLIAKWSTCLSLHNLGFHLNCFSRMIEMVYMRQTLILKIAHTLYEL